MDLSVYIKELLFLHDCVIIPEFGGFIANYRPARINHESNTLIPPAKDISFNKSLTHNDGLLISYISEVKGVGYVDAKRMVDRFVKDIVKQIEKGKRTPFDEIGVFFFDNQKNLQFEPDLSTNFLLDAYGLSEFTFAPLEDFDLQKRIGKKLRDKEPVKLNVRRKVLWRVALAVPILVALVVVPLKTDLLKFKTNVSSLNPLSNTEMIDSGLDQPAVDEDTFAEEVVNEGLSTESLNDEEDLVTTATTEEILEDEIVAPVQSDNYYIIAGSFRNIENARRFNNDLTTQGYNSLLLEPIDGLHRVTLNGYPTKESAVTDLTEFRQNPANNELWILRK